MRKTSPLMTLRKARTFSQEQFAKLIGVSQQTLSKYEHGKLTPTPDMQARIAALLGVGRHEVFPVEPDRISA
jgi:transcriptional regulator with XRE-family HTH domain